MCPDDLHDIHRYITGVLNTMDCPCVALGGTANHIHALFVLDKNKSLASVVGSMKRSSSMWMKTKAVPYRTFAWQDGYGAFSVSQSSVDAVRTYINNQEEHHKRMSFTDELKAFLNKYNVEYDERYL